MSDNATDSTSAIVKSSFKDFESNKSVLQKTARLTINLIANILICLTVFVSVSYACSSPTLNVFNMHIIFCVLGYQFFMCQGILVLSNYNGWSIYIRRQNKKQLHWILQLCAFILVVVGSGLMVCEKPSHFNTAHGTLGLCALITSLMSVLNGLLAMYASRLISYVSIFWIKFIHYFTGIGSMFLSASSLCAGFNIHSFRTWAGNDDAAAVLMFITCLFTVIVSIDFWIITGNRLRNLL